MSRGGVLVNSPGTILRIKLYLETFPKYIFFGLIPNLVNLFIFSWYIFKLTKIQSGFFPRDSFRMISTRISKFYASRKKTAKKLKPDCTKSFLDFAETKFSCTFLMLTLYQKDRWGLMAIFLIRHIIKQEDKFLKKGKYWQINLQDVLLVK